MTREEFIEKWGASMGHGFTDEELSADLDELFSLPPAEGAETILKEGLDDGRYADIVDGINIDVKQPFYQAIIRYAEDVVAAQQPKLDPKKVQWSGYGELGNISQKPPQPTAEGADVIASLIESLGEPTEVHNHSYSIRPYTVEGKTEWWMFHDGVGSGEPLAQWLSKFATLHAQRIADKMVEEKCKKCRHKGLPNSIQEALNSGDGVYRP